MTVGLYRALRGRFADRSKNNSPTVKRDELSNEEESVYTPFLSERLSPEITQESRHFLGDDPHFFPAPPASGYAKDAEAQYQKVYSNTPF